MDNPDQQSSSESELFSKAHRGCQRSREALVIRHKGLAYKYANLNKALNVPYEDRVSAAFEGLLSAVDRFEPQRGHAFSTFAVPRIRERLQREHLQWLDVHVPRRLSKSSVSREQHRGASDQRALAALAPATLCAHANDFERVMGSHGADPTEDTIELLDLQRVDRMMGHVLSQGDRRLMRMAYGTDGGDPVSCESIARLVGMSAQNVRNRLRRARQRMERVFTTFQGVNSENDGAMTPGRSERLTQT